jgi:hypothetical protein
VHGHVREVYGKCLIRTKKQKQKRGLGSDFGAITQLKKRKERVHAMRCYDFGAITQLKKREERVHAMRCYSVAMRKR